MRLDKFISKATELSRKEAKRALHAEHVQVNGHIIKDGSVQVNPEQDDVALLGEALSVATTHRYLLLYKPEGFECSLKPKEHPSVIELIALPETARLRMAGRLDVDTTGALLLSDDGAWLHRVTSPKKHQVKIYELTLAESMDATQQAEAVTQIGKGILLENETQKTQPARIEFLSPTQARLHLTEGKYHQVKRMMAYFGNHVTALHRAQIGNLTLAGLEKGESRFLSEAEMAQF